MAEHPSEHLLFLTGHLARSRLERVLTDLGKTAFTFEIIDIGVKVAALMTEEIISRRLKPPLDADRVILPGRYRGDLDRLSERFGVRFVRGPDEVADLPVFLGRKGKPVDLSKHEMRIFAEIVDASALSLDALMQRALKLSAAGADVIDLGCLPETPFPHLADAVRGLKAQGLSVSVDSANLEELESGAAAGADYLLSLTEETIGLAIRYGTIPVLIPAVPGDLEFAWPRHRCCESSEYSLHCRSRARSDPFRFRQFSWEVPRGSPPLARC